MKCPTCGTDNKSTNKACYRCGHILDDSVMQPKGNASSLWYSSTERKPKPAPPPFWGDTKGQANYDDNSDFIVLHDESSRSNAAQDIVERGAPVPDNRTKLERAAGKQEINIIVPARPAPAVHAFRRDKRYKIRWPRLVFSVLAILVLFTGLGYGAFTLYKLAVNSASQLIAEKTGTTPVQDPLVERVTIDGETWHRITFYGKDGDMVLLDNPKRSLPIQNGKAELMLDDQGYIPENLDTDKVTVSLEAVIISPDNKETKITIPPYVIDVPLAPLKLVLPQEQSSTTYNDSILVKIKVAPGSTRVLIGGQNVTDHVSADGYVSYSVTLTPDSINNIQITVVTDKYRKNVYQLKVDRPTMEVPIQLDKDSTALIATENDTVKLSGNTQPGAVITTDAKINGNIRTDSFGAFSFTAVLKQWGYNDITITSTTSDGHTSKLVHTVNHEPVLDRYTTHAQVLDYNYLTSAADNLIGRVYMIKGTIVKKLESDNSDYYLFNVGSPGDSKLLVVEYTMEDGLKPNQYYQLFADVSGTFDNYPVLTVRGTAYRVLLPMPSGYGTLQPGSSSSSGASASPDNSATASPDASESPGNN